MGQVEIVTRVPAAAVELAKAMVRRVMESSGAGVKSVEVTIVMDNDDKYSYERDARGGFTVSEIYD